MIVNEILYAVTRRLNELYPEYPIYTDSVEQGLEEPCFFVNILEPSRKTMLGGRSYQQNGFCIQYFPEDLPQRSEELNAVADCLMDEMEFITLQDGSHLRGSGRSYRVADGVLSFFVSYNLFLIRKEEKEDTMKEIEVHAEVSNGNKETRN